MRVALVLFLTGILFGCGGASSYHRGAGIDQKPMYGGFDRKADPSLNKADKEFIANVTKEFGSQEKACQMFVEQGVRYYQRNNYSMAMKRFNQAWLIDPQNPGPYWGFAIVYHDEGKNCEAKEMIDISLLFGLSEPIALADAGRIYTLCAVSDTTLESSLKENYYKESDECYRKAISKAPGNDYIYLSWATALYWRGDYNGAWEKVNKHRELGGAPPGQFINMLRDKMSEPKI